MTEHPQGAEPVSVGRSSHLDRRETVRSPVRSSCLVHTVSTRGQRKGLALGFASHLLRVAVGESARRAPRKAAQGEIVGLMKETVSGTAVVALRLPAGHGSDLARLTVPQSAPGADGPCSSSGAQRR